MKESEYVVEKLGKDKNLFIYDILDGNHSLLLKSLSRLKDILSDLPPHKTISMWLFDKVQEGPRFALLYMPLEDMEQAYEIEFNTKRSEIKTKAYKDLTVITCTSITEKFNGDEVLLFTKAINEINKLKLKRLKDISFSNIGKDVMYDEATLTLYCE